MYFESDEARTKALVEMYSVTDRDKNEAAKKLSEVEIGEVKSMSENIAIVELSTTQKIGVKKVNGRWFLDIYR